MTQKTTLSANGSPEERILRFGLCLSWHLKWAFHIGTLLKPIGIVLETHFGFGFRNRSSVGVSLVLPPPRKEIERSATRAASHVYDIHFPHIIVIDIYSQITDTQ